MPPCWSRPPYWALGVLSCAAIHSAAQAQVDPGVLNPGLQQQQQLQDQQFQRLPDVQREAQPPLIREEEAPVQDGAGDPELKINRVVIQGARVVSADTIQSVFEPILDKVIRFKQLQAVLDQASNLYRDAGYFTSRVVIPQGGLKEGVLTLVAVEGYLDQVDVVGKGSPALKRWVQSYLAPILSTAARPKPIRFSELERQILLLQSVGGLRFSSTLAQGQQFAASKLILDLDPYHASGSLNINNNVQPQLGNFQVVAQAQANLLSLWQPVQFDLYGSNAFPYGGGSASGNVGLSTPITNSGLTLSANGSLTSTSSTPAPIPLGDGSSVDFTSGGESWLGSLSLRYPLILSRTASLGVSLSGEVQNATSNTYVDQQLAVSNPSRLRVVRLGVDGTLSTPFYASSANLQISQGLPIANAIDSVTLADTNGSLPYGSVSYTSARLTLRHQQRVAATNTFVTLTGLGQLSSTTLPGPEDFSYGGPFLGRAYRGSYIIGDQGAAAGIELSHAFYASNWSLTPFLFADYGVASNNGLVLTPDQYSAASYGLGLRGGIGSFSNYELGWAVPAGSYPASAGRAGVSNSIVYFRAGLTF